MLPLSRITFPHFQYSSPSDTSHPPPQVKDLQASPDSPLIPACKKLWQGTINTGKRRSQQHKREGRSSGLGPTGHEDAEFNSNPPIPRIKVYLYMILLFTASRSLKYHLSGNKTPCPIPHIGTIYREGERGEKNSNKTKEIKKRTAATMDPEEPVSHPPNHIILQTKSSDPMAALQNPATRMISGENSRQICFELRSPSLLT